MGSKKKPDIPETPLAPTYQEDPRYGQGIDDLLGLGGRLTKFDLTGDLAPLQETIETSPQMTSLYLKGLRAELEPLFEEERQQSINVLAAQGKLSGSTLPSVLGDIEKRKMGEYQKQTSAFGLADIERAMKNRLGLFGTGLNTLQTGTSMAGQSQEMMNKFALDNYQNRLAYQEAEYARNMGMQDTGGSMWGTVGGVAGGALGACFGGPAGAALGYGLGSGIGGGFDSPGGGYDWSKPLTSYATAGLSSFGGGGSKGIQGGLGGQTFNTQQFGQTWSPYV